MIYLLDYRGFKSYNSQLTNEDKKSPDSKDNLKSGTLYSLIPLDGRVSILPSIKNSTSTLSEDPNPSEIKDWILDKIVPRVFDTSLREINNFGVDKKDIYPFHSYYCIGDAPWMRLATFFVSEFGSILSYNSPENYKKYEIGEKLSETNQINHRALNFIEKDLKSKFPDNQVPFKLTKYILEKAISEVCKELKSPKPKFTLSIVISNIESNEFGKDFLFLKKAAINVPKGLEKVPDLCFRTDAGSKYFPTLSKRLIACGGRDIRIEGKTNEESCGRGPIKPGLKTGDSVNKLPEFKKIAEKKKSAFIEWVKSDVIPKYVEKINQIEVEELQEFLQKNKIEKKLTFDKDDEVLYLRKDKSMEDYNKIPDTDDGTLEKEIVARGNVISVEDDVVSIRTKSGEEIKKDIKSIVKKLEKEESQEDKEEESQADKEKDKKENTTEEKKPQEKKENKEAVEKK